jgi:hypothetical protein
MTEAEWSHCTELDGMLSILAAQDVSERKVRLFSAACCRLIWQSLYLPVAPRALPAIERVAEGEPLQLPLQEFAFALETTLNDAMGGNRTAADANLKWPPDELAARAALRGLHRAAEQARAGSIAVAAALATSIKRQRETLPGFLRCIFGNPFRHAALDPAWRTPTVVSLAHAASEVRSFSSGHLDPDRLAILADALEEAGCTEVEILIHLHGPGPHVWGCWPVDLVLTSCDGRSSALLVAPGSRAGF